MEADEALKTIGEIEEIINNTIRKTQDAQQTLSEAAENANSALEKVLEAGILAKNTSDAVGTIAKQVELLRDNVTLLTTEADDMSFRADQTEAKLNEFFELTKTNNSLINAAKEAVGKAGKNQEEVSKKIEELLVDVKNIMNELQNSPNINETEIDRLEEEIRLTEEKIRETQLEETLADLQGKHQMQAIKIDQYKVDIVKLQADVDNIEDIVRALPMKCFRGLELEP